MSYIYLASPYSSPYPELLNERWQDAIDACAWIAKFEGRAVHSSIVHWHPIAFAHKLPTDFKFWQNMNYAFIGPSAAVWVLTIDGWKESVGVASEITFARALSKPVLYLQPPAESGDYCVREQPK